MSVTLPLVKASCKWKHRYDAHWCDFFHVIKYIYTLRILMSLVFVFVFLVSNDTFNDTLKTDDNYSHSPVVYWFWSSFSLFGILC